MLKSFSTKIEEEYHEAMKELSKQTRISQADLIREALKDLLRKYEKGSK